MTEEFASCPRCNTPLENYSRLEGGYCPKCADWFPEDLIRQADEENE
jgi:uncharacterized protein YbaR (Trm112 family)